jgi:hypothetical protein
MRLVLIFPFLALHVFLIAHILAHTYCSMVHDSLSVGSPLPNVYSAHMFVIVSK